MKNSILLFSLLLFSYSWNVFSQDEETYFGFYVGANNTVLESDFLESSSDIGYEVGLSTSIFLHTRGDAIVELFYSSNRLKLQGEYATYDGVGDTAIHAVEHKYNIENVGLNTYYNHYLFLADDDRYFVSALAGFKLALVQWNLLKGGVDNEYYKPYDIEPYQLQNMEETNVYFSGGLSGGIDKVRVVLLYNRSLMNPLRYIQVDNDTKEATGTLSYMALNLIYLY